MTAAIDTAAVCVLGAALVFGAGPGTWACLAFAGLVRIWLHVIDREGGIT